MKHSNLLQISNPISLTQDTDKNRTYIQSLNTPVKASLNTLRHQATPTSRTEVMLHSMLSESIFLHELTVQTYCFEFNATGLNVDV